MKGDIEEMSGTRYRRGKAYAADMAEYARAISGQNTNTSTMSRMKRNLIRALREDVTEKQRQALLLYYGEGLNMKEIGARLGVDRSTVSRNIMRGEARLRRCLRYGAEIFLRPPEEEEQDAPFTEADLL